MKLTMQMKLVLGVAIAGIIFAVVVQFNLLPSAVRQASAVPQGFALATDEAKTARTAVDAVALPTTKVAPVKGPVLHFNVWAWNAQMAFFFANGGPQTTVGSLMEKHGVTLKIDRQDDTNKSQEEQVKFATALAGGDASGSAGTQFVIIMGDQAAGYLAGANKLLSKLGDDYHAEVIASVGKSKGEDAWWGPQEWAASPEAMKGEATAAVLREGDWNIVQYKLANDGIKSNPDPTTIDPDAHNFFACDDYLKCVEMYVRGVCETRPVARNGKVTREPKREICVKGYATWTPGDVNGAKAKGGLVRLLSTKENVNQMPAVIIGIHRWDMLQAKKVTEMLAAAFEGADQVHAFDAALSRAGQASYAIYAEQSPAYWIKYYKGVVERDKTGQPVPLGGSDVMNYADNLLLFGLSEDSGGLDGSLFKATYEGFGNIVKQQYPDLLPSFPPVQKAVNTAFLEALKDRMSQKNASVEHFEDPAQVNKDNQVAARDWSIQFESGRATFSPAAEATLRQLYDQLVVGGGLQIEIAGHTDNTGDPDGNQNLSEKRAQAVKGWMQQRAQTLFPDNRFSIKAFGQTKPVATNDTLEGRAKNRRVSITLGSK